MAHVSARHIALVLGLGLWPLVAGAQQDDRSYLVALLEDNLSDAGRTVTITGFAGALSSVATLDELTIADDDGVWITLRDVSLDWSRSALLSGNVSVNALTAGEIILDRLPGSAAGSAMPTVEGAAFSLPDLPVSVNIGRIAADHIVLGQSVLGEVVEGSAQASLSLVGGEGQISVALDRRDDGPDGSFSLDASYANATGELVVSLDAREEAGGIAARLLSVPGAPSTGLTIKGRGPLDGFDAAVALTTDGQPRLTGQVAIIGKADGQRDFSANLKGDLAPVFWPEYREFLGNSLDLSAKGSRMADGRMTLSELSLRAGALTAKGTLALAADGLPEKFQVNLSIQGQDQQSLLLPLTTAVPTRIQSARLTLGFDAAQSDAWTVGGLIMGLDRTDVTAQSLSLSGGGNIVRSAGAQSISADLSFLGDGVVPADAGLSQALGKKISGAMKASWQRGKGQTDVSELSLTGDSYALNASGAVQGLSSGFGFGGRVAGNWSDLSRLSLLTGLPLSGTAALSVSGSASALGDAFDLRFAVDGTDLGMGIAQLDQLLAGQSQVSGQVSRSETGTILRDIKISAGDLTGKINGTLTSTAVSVLGDVTLPDLGALGPGYRGNLSGKAAYIGTLQDGILTLTGTGEGFGIGQAEVDRVLSGPAFLDVTATVTKGMPQLQEAVLDGQSLDLTAKGSSGGSVSITAQLANLALILPKFPGPVTVSGTLRPSASGSSVSLTLAGPAQVAGTLTGTVSPGFGSANLAFGGKSLADVANPFLKPRALSGTLGYDLQLKGPLTTNSLTGRVTLSGGRLADPSLGFGVQNIEATANLSAGQARVLATAEVSTGGTVGVSGQTSLTFPFQGALDVDVRQVLLREQRLYETLLGGTLTVDGPLAGGASVSGTLDLGRTELQIPSSGLSGSVPIPPIMHVNEPADVHATRVHAGLVDSPSVDGGHGGSGNYLLDIIIQAPNQIFLRGRGLDAELGGSLRLRGTTASIRPEGSFDLIRGRLDVVGRRLILSQAQLVLEGEFIPRVDIVASIEDADIISTIRISGPASDPALSFESSPQLPDEEILAQVLFGKRLQTLSAFQAAQLAAAVRTLAGQGGEGLVGKIRKGSGLDNLDIQTDETGQASLTAGKYLSEKVYSEITIDQTGTSQIDLNFDVRPHITLKGKLDTKGDTGVGLYLEKNY